MPLMTPNIFNLPLARSGTVLPANPLPENLPPVPPAPTSLGIAGGSMGSQTNPAGSTHSVGSGGTGPSSRNAGRGAVKAIKAQDNVNDALKTSSLAIPLTDEGYLLL